MFRQYLLIKIIFFCFVTSNLYSFEKDAEQLVQSTTDDAKEIILNKQIKNSEKKIKIEKIALKVVDVDGLSRFSLGSHRKNLSEKQLAEYTRVFRLFFAKNISSRLQNYSDQNIIVYGESLGTAVAIDLAKDHKFAGVILESPFTSMLKLSRKYYPWAPTGLLLKDKYETDKKINKVFSPILILHGRKDNIVPFEMGESLFKQANKPKYNYFIDNDDHMMDFNEALVNSINQFIKNLN